jgi:hypothetical protein
MINISPNIFLSLTESKEIDNPESPPSHPKDIELMVKPITDKMKEKLGAAYKKLTGSEKKEEDARILEQAVAEYLKGQPFPARLTEQQLPDAASGSKRLSAKLGDKPSVGKKSCNTTVKPPKRRFLTGWSNPNHKNLGYICPFCEKKYSSAELLAQHAIYRRCPFNPSKKVMRCKTCKQQIHGVDNEAVEYHLASKHQKQKQKSVAHPTKDSSSSSSATSSATSLPSSSSTVITHEKSVTHQAKDSSEMLNTAFCEEDSQGQTGGKCICIATL